MTAEDLEKLIGLYMRVSLAEPDLRRRRNALLRMKELVESRSSVQIRSIKIEQGIKLK